MNKTGSKNFKKNSYLSLINALKTLMQPLFRASKIYLFKSL